MMPFSLFGRPLVLRRYSEVHFSSAWKHSTVIREGVQTILDGVEEWDPAKFDVVVETVEFSTAEFVDPTVSIVDAMPDYGLPFWAQHRAHTARQPELSPFVAPRGDMPMTNLLTIELAGSPDRPILARLYPGDEMMPLPWQSSIRIGPRKDKDASADFWRNRAFVSNRNYYFGTVTPTAPAWYSAL